MSVSPLSQAVTIFFSYAFSSSTDRRLFKRLTTHLSMLRRERLIDAWYDSAISSASTLPRTLEACLNAADIIVLLISAEFVASDRCYEQEMRRALELSAAGSARLIPVILSPTEWEMLPLSQFRALPENGTAISRWRDREQALSEVAQGIRKVVEELAGQATRLFSRALAPRAPLHVLPYRQNDLFTDRETILAALSAAFASAPGGQTALLALNGLGGMGKTQIALEYIYRSSHSYQAILWLNASSRARLCAEISALAERLALSRKELEDEDQLFAAVKRWLEHQSAWLLVLDQVEDAALVELIVPTASNGHVLLTTRTQAIEEVSATIPVLQMDTEASIQLLLRRAGLLAAQASLAQAAPTAIAQATAIAQLLDGFPLALDQVGAYLAETGCGLAAYQTLFQQERAALLSRRGRLIHGQQHPDSVAITLMLTIEKVRQQRTANLHVLHLLSFLAPEAIPRELLEDGAGEVSEPLRALLSRPLELNEVLADLHRYALVHYLADSTMLRIHRLVQAVVIDTLTTRQKRNLASQAIRMVNRVFPEVTAENWPECERYRPQAQHCADLISSFKLTLKEGALLLQRLGAYCSRQACYAEAENYLIQALHLHEQQTASDREEIARTLNSLALLYYRQARYQEAEQTHLRALALREQMPEPRQLQIAESLHNLALLAEKQGNYQQAEQLYQRVLALEEQSLGPAHPDSAKTLNNLGLLYFEQGHYQQAETAYQRALAIYKRSLPANHPDTIYPLDGLGALAEKRGNYQQAEELYQRVLALCEQTFGASHPETAHSLNKLADIYEAEDKDQQAATLYQRALSIGEQVLRAEHPDVALFLNNLAFLAEKRGEYQQAEQYYQRALKIYEQALGTEHLRVADVLNNLGVLFQTMQREEQAEPLLRRALAIRTRAAGPTHPDTAQSLSNLADLLGSRQAYAEAEELFKQALALRRQAFGPAHPDVIRTREKYATLLEQIQRDEEAARLRRNDQQQVSEETSQEDH